MPEMSKCKITVLKRMVNIDLAKEYLDIAGDFGACERFSDGQEMVVSDISKYLRVSVEGGSCGERGWS